MMKILIFGETSTVSSLKSACELRGFEPVVLYEKELCSPCDYDVIDIWREPTQIAYDLKERYGVPAGIVNCIEQYVGVLDAVCHKLGLITANASAARTLRSKALMKECWEKHRVPTPRVFHKGPGVPPQLSGEDFPVIVKPVYGAASAGVVLAHDQKELERARQGAARFNATALGKEGHARSGIMIEEYVDGPEFCVDQVWQSGRAVAQGVLAKGVPRAPDFMDRLYLADPDTPADELWALCDTAREAVMAAGVRHGATHTEVRRDERSGEYVVIEAALRPGAGCGLYPTYKRAYGNDFFSALVDACIGLARKDGDMLPEPASDRHYWYNVGYSVSGRILSLDLPETFYEKHPYVDRVIWRRRVGDYLPREGSTYGYLAWFDGVLPAGEDQEAILRSAGQDLIVKVDDGQ